MLKGDTESRKPITNLSWAVSRGAIAPAGTYFVNGETSGPLPLEGVCPSKSTVDARRIALGASGNAEISLLETVGAGAGISVGDTLADASNKSGDCAGTRFWAIADEPINAPIAIAVEKKVR